MSENARTKFKKDDRVRLSASGRRKLHAKDPDRLGTVVGFSPMRSCVRVLRDGNTEAMTYHMDYWDLIPPDAPVPDPESFEAAA